MADNLDPIELRRRARRRLVGAIALVVFVVIFLPIVFDREPRPISQDLTIEIPPREGSQFSSRILPPQAIATPKEKNGSEPAVRIEKQPKPPEVKANNKAAAPEKSETAALASKARAATSDKPGPSGDKSATPPATANAESFVIPLGLFRNPDNVKKVRGWVASAGLKSITEPGTATDKSKPAGEKVMAGPFSSRDAAEKARERLKSRGIDAGPVTQR